MAIGWFDAVMWGVIRMSNSPIGGDSESTCQTESVDEEECCVGTFIRFLVIGVAFFLDERFLTRSPLEVCLDFFLMEEGCYSSPCCKPCRLSLGSLTFISRTFVVSVMNH